MKKKSLSKNVRARLHSIHWLWLAVRLFFSKRTLLNSSALLSLLGLSLGVAALVASMAVMSGFEETLKKAVSDITGHVQIIKGSVLQDDWLELESRIISYEPSLISVTRFAYSEAVVAHQGKVFGVIIQGLDPNRYDKVLNFQSRLTEGEFKLKKNESDPNFVMIGKGIAKKMSLKTGDSFSLVVPISNSPDLNQFKRKVSRVVVAGVLDLGKYDWNDRFIVTDLASAQAFADIKEKYTGLFLRFANIDDSRRAGLNLAQKLGRPYWVKDWRDLNENLFEAVEFERVVIFFVVLIIVVIAAFNLASSLFVNVLQRYSDISILRSLGLSQKDVLKLFAAQGVMFGGLGLVVGFLIGVLLCYGFMWLQNTLSLISGSVYRIDRIDVVVRPLDLFFIVVATLIICLLATLGPARRGAKISIIEGLRYG